MGGSNVFLYFEVINTDNLDQAITIVTAHDIVECSSNEPIKGAHFILTGFIIELFPLITLIIVG